MQTIIIDTREKPQAIGKILKQFEEAEIKTIRSKLFVGDYQSLDNGRLVIDRKQNLQELCGNVCQQHERFVNELYRAKEHGIKIIILCEHSPSIKCLEDVQGWVNPRLRTSPKALTGEKLYKILSTLAQRYNVDFEFCGKHETGKRIIELLGGKTDEN
jgi:hypothetical protein